MTALYGRSNLFSNSAGRNGGALYMSKMNFALATMAMIKNTAENGGGLYMIDILSL